MATAVLRGLRRLLFQPTLRRSLLQRGGPAGPSDVELAAGDGDSASGEGLAKVQLHGSVWAERAFGVLLAAACVVPTAFVLSVVVHEWQSNPQQRSWLILGLGFYIVAGLKALFVALARQWEQICYLRVEIRRTSAPTLFEAVSHAIAAEAERAGATCSRDAEALSEHDAVTGEFSTKLRFWSSRPQSLRLSIRVGDDGDGDRACEGGASGSATPASSRAPSGSSSSAERGRWLHLNLQYSPGEDVVCGRDARLTSRATLAMSVATSPDRALADKRLLNAWLEEAYQKWVKPVKGVVKIYALQESSSDWVPEWKFERVKPCKTASGTGQAFYLERESLQRILVDARLWASQSLRVYLVSGPPGTGKSEFVIWLASQLGLPIYRLCLSSASLTDDRLAQLLSQSAISDNAVLVQVDEFQQTAERWLQPPAGKPFGVSAGGFCECLQGSTAMAKGVVVLSGTGELLDEQVRTRLPAVFRRIHCTSQLRWMGVQDVRSYFRHFLARFVPNCGEEEWEQREEEFTLAAGPWSGARHVSIDMLKQYLMHQITEASCRGVGGFVPGAAASFLVRPDRRSDFFALIADRRSAEAFLDAYAPVDRGPGGGGALVAHP